MNATIAEGMTVVGADGGPVGTVDRVEGNVIKLAEQHSVGANGDHHHEVSLDQVSGVDGETVRLNVDAATLGLKQKREFAA